MQKDLTEALLKAMISGAVERMISSDDEGPVVEVLLYGGIRNSAGSDPDDLLDGIRAAVDFLERQGELVGDLGAQARLLLPGGEEPITFMGLKAIGKPLVSVFRQAEEKVNSSGKPWARPVVDGLQILIGSLQSLEGLQECDEQMLRVERSLTFSFQGPRKLVDDLAVELEALARRHQAASLSAYATSRGFRVTECQEGHVVLLEGEKVIHTNVEVTQEMRESLEGKYLPPSEIKCPDSVQEEESEEEAAPAGSTS